jgi:hypothetical protein
MWVASGLVGITQPQSVTAPLVANFGLSGLSAALAVWISCFIDIAIGALLILRYLPRALSVIQFALVAAYTIGLSVAEPSLWTDPFGPLLKNIPILAAIVIFSAVENDR